MRKIFKLYWMLQKNGKAERDANSKIDTNTMISCVIGVLIVAALFYFSNRYSDFLALYGGISSIMMVTGILIGGGIIILGIMKLIRSMYTSSDIEILITMPFSSMEIALLRVFSFFQLALVASLGIMLSPTIGYSIANPLTIGQWGAVLLTAILVPIFATCAVVTVVVLLMSVLKIFRSRETLRVVGAIFLFFALCGYLFIASGDNVDAKGALIAAMGVVQKIKYAVPPLGFGVDFITLGDPMYLLYMILTTVGMFLLFFLVTKLLYLRGAMNMQDAGKGAILTDADLDRYCRKKPVGQALLAKEYHMVRRNPTYLLYNFIVGALWPVMIIILFKQMLPLLSNLINDGEFIKLTQSFNFESFALISAILAFVMLFITGFPISMQTIAYSSISREGSSFPIMKQIPVSYETQLNAKRGIAATIAQLSVTIYSAMILIAASIFLHFSILYCIIPFIFVILATELHTDVDMYFGIREPNVSWDDEKVIFRKPIVASIVSLVETLLPLVLFFVVLIGFLANAISNILCFGIAVLYGVLMLVAIVILRKRILVDGVKAIRKLRF